MVRNCVGMWRTRNVGRFKNIFSFSNELLLSLHDYSPFILRHWKVLNIFWFVFMSIAMDTLKSYINYRAINKTTIAVIN